MNKRRDFLKKVSLLSIGLVATKTNTPLAAQDINPSLTFLDGFAAAPYLQHLTPTSTWIMFITHTEAYSWIEYETEDGRIEKVRMEEDGIYDSYNTLNKIHITNLRPRTKYRYRACSKAITLFEPYKLEYGPEIATPWYTFQTPAKNSDNVSCLILNDIHDSPQAFNCLFNVVKDRSFDFVALNGDTFDYQTDEKQIIDNLLAPSTELFASEIPFMMIRGNHETRGKFRREFKNYFKLPNDSYHFTFNQGPVCWVVLDTGEDKPDDHPVYAGIVNFDAIRERQAQWLNEVVKTEAYQKAKYRVVIMHIPPYHSGDWHGPTHCRTLFDPIFASNNVDLVVSGHTHRYGVHPPEGTQKYPIIIGGGSKDGSRTIIHIAADNEQLHLDMIRDDGQKVGEYTIKG